MRKLTEEDLRILLNADSSPDHDYEIKLYESVYKGLNSLPKVEVENVVSGVVKAIEHKLEWQSLLKFYAVGGLIIFFGIAFLVAGVSMVDKNLVVKFAVVLGQYKLICLFALMSFLIISVVDKLLSFKQVQRQNS
ncbi:MAG: hypothetical protein EOO85_30450 [Pedobacter sp.]|nr:MAG: hypothetical protein EOO85_30450 [Pedobacter sp.]